MVECLKCVGLLRKEVGLARLSIMSRTDDGDGALWLCIWDTSRPLYVDVRQLHSWTL